VRVVIAVLLIVTLYLQYVLWFGRGGIRDVNRLEKAVAEQREEISRLQDRNRALAAEVMDLKQGLEAIEERARSEMGMIKQGEAFFRLIEPPDLERDSVDGDPGRVDEE
jgi:cell division protein FtsB